MLRRTSTEWPLQLAKETLSTLAAVAHTATTDSRPVAHLPLGRSEEAALMLENYKGVEGRALAARPATLLKSSNTGQA